MKCVILQPSYIPWRGYFHQILKADIFVFYDDVQYDTRGWRNRNKIKTDQGLRWLTIPVHNQGSQTLNIPINKIKIDWGQPWNQNHLKSLQYAYKKAPFYEVYAPFLADFYSNRTELLADLTISLTIALSRELGISQTRFIRSSELNAQGNKTDRLLDILQKLGADHYISGPSASSYIEEEKMIKHGITLEYMSYNYPEYPQLHSPYVSQVSILDLLFMTGPDALNYFKDDSQN
jgi:hypothetical protein